MGKGQRFGDIDGYQCQNTPEFFLPHEASAIKAIPLVIPSAASILASWKPPIDGVVKVNFCDLEFLEGQTVGIGAVLRDIRGVFLAGMARKHMRREEVWSVDGHSYARSGKFCSPPRDSVCSVGRGLHSFSEVCCGHKF
ncbi:unnamed protein product [Ilex paraguariensis]|uniref:Uncharacterized protein n=1 Tax=Ilex paraguariensis TaxID=185542 RepID=A0ABC8T5H5_9AQUA